MGYIQNGTEYFRDLADRLTAQANSYVNSMQANSNWIRQGDEILNRLQIYGLMARNEAYGTNAELNSRFNKGIDSLVNTYHAKTDAAKAKISQVASNFGDVAAQYLLPQKLKQVPIYKSR